MSPEVQGSPHRRGRRITVGMIVLLILIGLLVVDSILRMVKGDITGQLELAVVIGVGLFIVLPVVLLAKLIAKSRLGRFIHANPRITRIFRTKRFVLELREEPYGMLVFQGFILLLVLLISAVTVIVLAVRWVFR